MALLGTVACEDPIVIQENSAQGVIQGVVLSASRNPVSGASVRALFSDDCDQSYGRGTVAQDQTDQLGAFTVQLSLFLFLPKTYCFDVLVMSGALADTLKRVEVPTFDAMDPPDTAHVEFIVDW